MAELELPCFIATIILLISMLSMQSIDIQHSCVIRGALPARQLKFVLAWGEMHKDELMQNWELSKNNQEMKKIAPLFI